MMDWFYMTDKAIMEEMGQRLRSYRKKRKLSQKQLAERTGLSIFTIAQIEQGKAVSLSSLLPVLRELRLLNNLDAFIPNIPESPIGLLRKQRKSD
jgi:transcriptional regulator with XRE-family HTH domain